MRSTKSLYTASMPIRRAGRSSWSCCRSQAKAARSKRWNSDTSPPFQSSLRRLTPSIPASASRAACRSGSRQTIQPGRVDQPNARVGRPQGGQQIEVVVAQPGALARSSGATLRRSSSITGGPGLWVLEVERQVDSRCHRPRSARRAKGSGPGRSSRVRSAMRRLRIAADHAVVIEHGDPVTGEPHVALEPTGPHLERQLEGFDRVLGGVGSGASVGERDRRRRAGTEVAVACATILAGAASAGPHRLPPCSTCKAAS